MQLHAPMRLLGLSLQLLLLLLLLCVPPSSTLGALVTPPSYPINVSNSYKLPELVDAVAFPSLGTVLSPAHLAGRFAFSTAPNSGPMFVNRSCTGDEPGACTVTYRMSLLNDLDHRYGCNVTHPYNSGGEPIDETTMVMVERSPAGNCNFGTKAQIIAAIGAGAVLHTGCSPAPPQSCAAGLVITLANGKIPVPMPFLQYADAARWRYYLDNRNKWLMGESPDPGDYSQPLLVTFPATGPMVPEERAVLAAIVRNMDVNDRAFIPGVTSLRPWSVLADLNGPDPCTDRVVGMWCEDGHLVSVYTPGTASVPAFVGTRFDPLWGSLSRLRGLEMSQQNFQGALPDELCQLSQLRVLGFDRQGDRRFEVRQGLTALPDCIGTLPHLTFLSASANIIQRIPSTLRSPLFPSSSEEEADENAKLPALRTLVLDSNMLQGLPEGFSQNLRGLALMHLGSNPGIGGGVRPLPSFEGWGLMSKLQMRTCGFAGPVPPRALDNLPRLFLLDLGFNALTQGLPAMLGATNIDSIDLSHNNFTGGIPPSWGDLDSASSVTLAYNALSHPVDALGSMSGVKQLDLSHNALFVPVDDDETEGNVAGVVASMVNNQLESLNIDHNNLRGTWATGYLGGARVLKSISMAHNGLKQIAPDIYNMFIQEWDMSHNDLRGTLPLSTPVFITSMLLSGNPRLQMYPLPAWLQLSDAGDTLTQAGSVYSCSRLVYPALKNFRIEVDPEARGFIGCQCARGSFGRPPLCQAVPELAMVSPNAGFSSAEVGDDFTKMINSSVADGQGYIDDGGDDDADPDVDVTTRPGSRVSAPLLPHINDTLVFPEGFTDDWYGVERLTLGVSTTWTIGIDNLFLDMQPEGGGPQPPKNASRTGSDDGGDGGVDAAARPIPVPVSPLHPRVVELLDGAGNASWVASELIGRSARFQPVRMIRIQLHISRSLFQRPSDSIFVYEGGADLSGMRVANLLGTDRFGDPPPYPPPADADPATLSPTQTEAYQLRYGGAMRAIANRTLVEVVVLTNAASLHFTSRALGGAHFFATYSYSFACEPVSEYFLDDETNRCRPQMPTYHLASGVRTAVWAVAGVALVWIGVNVLAMTWAWDSPLYRASSRAFMLLLLALLAAFALGAMLYAAIPDVDLSPSDGSTAYSDTTAHAVCIGRVWLTCVPLAGILAIVFAKANRVDNIFSSMTLLKAQSVSDGAILRSVLAVLLCECTLLLVYSILPLSRPSLAPGSGSLSSYRVPACTLADEHGAMAWLGVQVAFLVSLMIVAGGLAFRTRNLPSAFNEAANISHCIIVLLVFSLLVPLTLLVHEQPEAAVLLQGLGQALLALLLTSILFGPKLFLSLTTNTAQQKAMLTDERKSSNHLFGVPATAGIGTGATHMQQQSYTPPQMHAPPPLSSASASVSQQSPRGPAPLPQTRVPRPLPRATQTQRPQQQQQQQQATQQQQQPEPVLSPSLSPPAQPQAPSDPAPPSHPPSSSHPAHRLSDVSEGDPRVRSLSRVDDLVSAPASIPSPSSHFGHSARSFSHSHSPHALELSIQPRSPLLSAPLSPMYSDDEGEGMPPPPPPSDGY